tara:strand:- start:2213 stop:2512 length:300 start_codon:yes stop_codon:yes gene_type:complete
MVINLFNVEPIRYQGHMAVLEVDVDSNAERVVVAHRVTLKTYAASNIPPLGVVRFRLPMTFATSDELIVIIFDTDRVYNASVLDGVRCEIMQSTADMSQ